MTVLIPVVAAMSSRISRRARTSHVSALNWLTSIRRLPVGCMIVRVPPFAGS